MNINWHNCTIPILTEWLGWLHHIPDWGKHHIGGAITFEFMEIFKKKQPKNIMTLC
jgi:hypothetical protein